jgi:hypothetical protein
VYGPGFGPATLLPHIVLGLLGSTQGQVAYQPVCSPAISRHIPLRRRPTRIIMLRDVDGHFAGTWCVGINEEWKGRDRREQSYTN